MALLLKITLIFMILINLVALQKPAFGAVGTPCPGFSATPDISTWLTTTDASTIRINANVTGVAPGETITLFYTEGPAHTDMGRTTVSSTQTITLDPRDTQENQLVTEGSHRLDIQVSDGGGFQSGRVFCSVNFTVRAFERLKCSIADTRGGGSSYGPGDPVGNHGRFWWEDINGNQRPYQGNIDIRLYKLRITSNHVELDDDRTDAAGNFPDPSDNVDTVHIPSTITASDVGWWRLSAARNNPGDWPKTELCTVPIYVSQTSGGPVVGTPPAPPSEGGSGSVGSNPCGTSTCPTAIGNIPVSPAGFTGRILAVALGLAGGIALIIMVIGSVKILMSAGDPQKVANGRDMIIAAIAGLLFLIFAVLILRFLGSDLFGLFTVT